MDCETTRILNNTKTENTSIVARDGDDDDVLFIPKPGRKLEPRPPPFLTKIYDMVDDPETDSFITWNSSRTGFVISDHNNFSAHVLPIFFKTTNFSSFVYQLNSYGFRKISWERYEYANQWFQAGKRHWLKNIKRRGQQSEWSQSGKKRARFTPDQDSTNATVESKLDALISEQNDMKRNIQTLRQNIDSMEDQLTSLEIPKLPELKDDKTKIAFFFKQFAEYLKKGKQLEASDNDSKRPQLDVSQNTEHPVEPAENTEKLLSSADGSESSIQHPKEEKTPEITEECQFWLGILKSDDAGFDSSEGQRYLDDLDSKAMIDEMIAPNIELQNEDDDRHIQLWL